MRRLGCLLVSVLIVTASVGCVATPPGPPPFYFPGDIIGPYEPKYPLQFSAIFLKQQGGIAADGYSGVIAGCVGLNNTNPQTTFHELRMEMYQVVPDVGGEIFNLVYAVGGRNVIYANQDDAQPTGGGTSSGLAPLYWVPVTETVNGSVQYAVHLWTVVTTHVEPYVPVEPRLFSEKWFNISYTPYLSKDLYHEGGRCEPTQPAVHGG